MFDRISCFSRRMLVLAACCAAAVPSIGQAQQNRVDLERPIEIGQIPILKVTPRGLTLAIQPVMK